MARKQSAKAARRSVRIAAQKAQSAPKHRVAKASSSMARSATRSLKVPLPRRSAASYSSLPLEIKEQIIEDATNEAYQTQMLPIAHASMTLASARLFVSDLDNIYKALAPTSTKGSELKRLMPNVIETVRHDIENDTAKLSDENDARMARAGLGAHLRMWDQSLNQRSHATIRGKALWLEPKLMWQWEMLQSKQKALTNLKRMAKGMMA